MFKRSKCEYLLIGLKPEVVGMPFHNAIGYRFKQWYGSFVQNHHRLCQWFPTGEEFLPREEFHVFRGGISAF